MTIQESEIKANKDNNELLQRIKYEANLQDAGTFVYFPIFEGEAGSLGRVEDIKTDLLFKNLSSRGIIELKNRSCDEINVDLRKARASNNREFFSEGYFVRPIEPAFSISCEKYAKLIAGEDILNLESVGIKFDDRKAILEIGKEKCQIPPHQNEHFLCRTMYKNDVNVPIDWSEIYEEITGFYQNYYGKPLEVKENKRMVYDAMQALNNRIKKAVNTTDNLFTWQEKTIKRNF
jgi:hypothetical protein